MWAVFHVLKLFLSGYFWVFMNFSSFLSFCSAEMFQSWLNNLKPFIDLFKKNCRVQSAHEMRTCKTLFIFLFFHSCLNFTFPSEQMFVFSCCSQKYHRTQSGFSLQLCKERKWVNSIGWSFYTQYSVLISATMRCSTSLCVLCFAPQCPLVAGLDTAAAALTDVVVPIHWAPPDEQKY